MTFVISLSVFPWTRTGNMIFVYTLLGSGSLLLALAAALAAGLLVGLTNGMLAGVVGLPDFIATYAVGTAAYGLKMLISQYTGSSTPPPAWSGRWSAW